MQISLSKSIRTETAHRLLNYHGPCAHLHGHSWEWEVTVIVNWTRGSAPIPTDDAGMVLDFSWLKLKLREHVHEPWDHALILHKDDPLVKLSNELEVDIRTLLAPSNEEPARVVLVPFNPTSENLCLYLREQFCRDLAAHRFGSGVWLRDVVVRCRETASSGCSVGA